MTRLQKRTARGGVLIVAAAVLATAAASAPPQSAGTSQFTLLRTVKLTRVSGLSFARLHTDNGKDSKGGTVTVPAAPRPSRTAVNVHLMSGEGPNHAVTTVQGEPGRLYRVNLPASAIASPSGLAVGSFTVWSDVRGEVSASRIGQLGPDGTDTLRIGGTLTVPAKTKQATFTAEVPVTVSYE